MGSGMRWRWQEGARDDGDKTESEIIRRKKAAATGYRIYNARARRPASTYHLQTQCLGLVYMPNEGDDPPWLPIRCIELDARDLKFGR